MSLLHQIGQGGSTQPGQSEVLMGGTGLFHRSYFSSLLPDNASKAVFITFMLPFSKQRLWGTETCAHCGTVSLQCAEMIAGDVKYLYLEKSTFHQKNQSLVGHKEGCQCTLEFDSS